jgi:hypothetical protein
MAVSQEIAYYLYDLAAAFHGLWTKGKEHTGLRFIIDDIHGMPMIETVWGKA